jgi:hypothetical protein
VGDTLLGYLTRLNIVLVSGTVLMGLSLGAYLAFHNFGNRVARAFVIVLLLVSLTYVGDVFLSTARLTARHPAAAFWLRWQWLGIAFVAPAYLYFSHRLLATTGDRSRWRLAGVAAGAVGGALTLTLVWRSQLLVAQVVGEPGAVHFAPGPLFKWFTGGFLFLTLWGVRGVLLARRRALTARSRRRLSYLAISGLAPLSAFPYLITAAGALAARPLVFRWLVALASMAAAGMLVVVAYAVAFQGALTPERHVRRELLKYLLQVPVLGFWIILLTQVVPTRFEGRLGLPRDVLVALTLVVGIVAFRFATEALKPIIDGAIYGRGGRDAMWLRHLDQRLLTDQDLQQLLENILTALCDLTRVQTGFVMVMRTGRLELDAVAGPRETAVAFLESLSQDDVVLLTTAEGFVTLDGFRVHPLRQRGRAATIGLLALADRPSAFTPDEETAAAELLAAAETALEDRVIQGRVLESLRDLEPELEGLQRLRGSLEPGTAAIGAIEASPIYSADFPHWVKEALTDYWGGPRLTDSPLLGLNIARRALAANDTNPAKAMRHVLASGIERLRPEGERSLTAYDWLAYNILELRFVRGLRVRDLATRMGLSESDLYRKQRVAIEALARQLAAMEGEPAGPRAAQPAPNEH